MERLLDSTAPEKGSRISQVESTMACHVHVSEGSIWPVLINLWCRHEWDFYTVLEFFFFGLFRGCTHGMWRFPNPQIIGAATGLCHGTAMPDLCRVCNTAHRVGSGIETASSWILVRFVSAEPQWELCHYPFWNKWGKGEEKDERPLQCVPGEKLRLWQC